MVKCRIEQIPCFRRLIYRHEDGRQKSLGKGPDLEDTAADIEIVALGKRRIHYRVTSQLRPKLVSAQISGIAAMQNYLETNAARLVATPDLIVAGE